MYWRAKNIWQGSSTISKRGSRNTEHFNYKGRFESVDSLQGISFQEIQAVRSVRQQLFTTFRYYSVAFQPRFNSAATWCLAFYSGEVLFPRVSPTHKISS